MKLKVILASVAVSVNGKKYEDSSRYVCPDDYEFVDQYTCQRRIVVPSELKCPSHCDKILNGKGDVMCIDDDSKSPSHRCPEGYLFARGDCLKVKRAPASSHCPEGYHEHGHGDKCKREEQFPLHSICKKGQKQQDDTCLLIEYGMPQYGCPSDFDFDGNSCVKKDVRNLDFSCKDGYWREGDRCVRNIRQPVQWRCPEGAHQHPEDPDRCARESEYPAQKKCRMEGRENHECFYNDIKEKTMTCPMGFVQSAHRAGDGGALCEKCHDRIKTSSRCEYKPADMTCPPDYYNSGHQCEKKVWGDFDHLCKHGATLQWNHLGNPICTTSDKVDKFKWCPQNSHRQGKECLGKEWTQLQSSCPDKYQNHHDKCLMHESVPRSKVCVAGDLENGKCLLKSLYPPHFYCPKDAHRVEDTCVRYDYTDKLTKCPTGYFHGDRGICFKSIRQPPIEECPKGTEPSHDDDGETVCVSTEICEPKRDCPWKFDLEGDVCVRTYTTKAKVEYEEPKKGGHHSHGHHGHGH